MFVTSSQQCQLLTRTPDVRERGHEGDGGNSPAKKQKKLTKHEQHLRKCATDLREAVADLKTTLTSYSLEDTETSDTIRYLSRFCDTVRSREHQRDATELAVLQFHIPLLEENDLSKLNASK